jgi:hypothetical protein
VEFKKAVRAQKKLRLCLDGPPKSGKTMSALRFAFALGKRVAVIDSENNSACLYAGMSFDGVKFDFDALVLDDYSPIAYTAAIKEAGRLKYDVVVIDSLSHAWAGEGGALEMKDVAADKRGNNSFTAWREVTPHHNTLIETILRSPCHIIATLRTKVEYVMEEEIVDGKKRTVPKKIGLKPIQRQGIEYEFDVCGDVEAETHCLKISASRCTAIDQKACIKPGAAFLQPLIEWLNEGETASPTSAPEVAKALEKTLFEQFYERIHSVRSVEEIKPLAAEIMSRQKELTQREIDDLSAQARRTREELATAGTKSPNSAA